MRAQQGGRLIGWRRGPAVDSLGKAASDSGATGIGAIFILFAVGALAPQPPDPFILRNVLGVSDLAATPITRPDRPLHENHW